MTASLSNLSRQRPVAEEQFIEQTPWANPQHPVHHQLLNAAQRQVSLQSRPLSPFTTPAPPRRVIDTGPPVSSASTIAALQSAQNSSVAPTPASLHHDGILPVESDVMPDDAHVTDTPSRHNGYILQESVPPAVGATRLAQENISISPIGGMTLYPGHVRLAASPPSKICPSVIEMVDSVSRNPFTSPPKPSGKQETLSAEQNLFTAFQRQMPRRISVNAGMDRGNT